MPLGPIAGLLLWAGALPVPGAEPSQQVVALLPLRALGASPEAVAALEQTLRNKMALLPEIALAPEDLVAAALKREQDCLSKLTCAASAATKAGARQLVMGTVSELGDAYMVDLKLVDARTGHEVRRVTHPISGRQELLIELLRGAAVELLAPARHVGRLSVKLLGEAPEVVAEDVRAQAVKGRGAQLFLDGKPVGRLPLPAPLESLPVGQHTLRVAQEGFHDATLFVEVRFDRTTEAFVDLERGSLAGVAFLREKDLPRPPLLAAAVPAAKPAAPAPAVAAPPQRGPWLKIAGWSGAGLGAVALVAGLTLHAKAYSTANQINQKEVQNQLTPADLALYGDVDTAVSAARVLYVVSGLTAVAGVAFLVWDGSLDAAAARAAAGPQALRLTPLVAPGTGGLTLTARFP